MTVETRPAFVVLYRPVRAGFSPATMTDSERQTIGAHFVFLRGLLDRGDLVLAGPRLDASFGLGVFHAESLDSAKVLIASDPAVIAGVFSAEVAEMRLSLLSGRPNGL